MIRLVLIVALALSSVARAGDGQIEISQAGVVAAGGFPYVVSSPGSYVLTSDLVVADPAGEAISVHASDVSIDLNGFSITGPIQCLGSGGSIVCTPAGEGTDGSGIRALGTTDTVDVRNGFVSGFGGEGIWLQAGKVTDVTVHSTDFGIVLGSGVVRGSQAIRNRVSGITVQNGTVEGCSAAENGSGISVTDGIAVGNTLLLNRTGVVSTRSLVRGNALGGNGTGILLFDGESYALENASAVDTRAILISFGAGSRVERNQIFAPNTGIRAVNSEKNLILTNFVHSATASAYDISGQNNLGPRQDLVPGEKPDPNPWTNFAN